MEPAFESAFRRPVHVVLRLKLEPLTLGHVFLLSEFGSPFFIGGEVSRFDLSLAAFVCAHPWLKAERRLKRWWVSLFIRLWGFVCRKVELASECEAFSAYVSEAMAFPKHKVDLNSDRPSLQSPWQFLMLARLMREFHLSLDQARDAPLLLMNSAFVADAESRGAISFWTPEEGELLEYAKGKRN